MRIKALPVDKGNLLVFLFDEPMSREEYEVVSEVTALFGDLVACPTYICMPGQDVGLGHPVIEALEKIEEVANGEHTDFCDMIEDLENIAGIASHTLREIWAEIEHQRERA